jgi:hypothetical protein
MKPSIKHVPRLLGIPTVAVVVIPLAAGVATAIYGVLSSNETLTLIALVASPVELLVLPFAVRSWFKAGRPRSIVGGAVTVAAAVVALPAVYTGLLMLNPFLPLLPWESGAVVKAEHFVKRHGFTQLGHPADQPVRTTDIMDNIFTTEEQLLEHRRGSLREHASGVVALGLGQQIVLFEPLAGNEPGFHGYRQVMVSHGGEVHMPHQEYGFFEWQIKRVNR